VRVRRRSEALESLFQNTADPAVIDQLIFAMQAEDLRDRLTIREIRAAHGIPSPVARLPWLIRTWEEDA